MRGGSRPVRAVAALALCALAAFAAPAHANGCEGAGAREPGLAELRARHAAALAERDAGALLAAAEALRDDGGDEERVVALLLLQRILDDPAGEGAVADALVIASRIRAGLARSLHAPFYRCQELAALREYVEAHGEGYDFAELWGLYVYRPQPFLEAHLAGLSRDEVLRVRFAVYRTVDPCDPFRFDNGCYAPFFSRLAEEAAGTPIQREAMAYAFETSLLLAACPHASEAERERGEAAARRWAVRIGRAFPDDETARSAASRLALLDAGTLVPEVGSDACRHFSDV